MQKLLPGTRVYFIQNGRKLRGIVAETLHLKARGEPLAIPVIRPFNRKNVLCNADRGGGESPLKLRWLPRNEVRKLPEPKPKKTRKKKKA